MRLREHAPRKHIHAWKLTKNYETAYPSVFSTHKLERECTDCGAKQHANVPALIELPPTPVRACADVIWNPGRLNA